MMRAIIYFCVDLPLDNEGRAFIFDIEGEAEVEGYDWEPPQGRIGGMPVGGDYTACGVVAIDIDGKSVKRETPVAQALWYAVAEAIESPNGRLHERALEALNEARREAEAEAKAWARKDVA